VGGASVNLLAIELLYLAFSLCLMRYPKLLGDDEKLTQSPFGIIQDPLRDVVNPFADATSKSQANGSRKRKIEAQPPKPSPLQQALPQKPITPALPVIAPQPAFASDLTQQQESGQDCTQQLESVCSPLSLPSPPLWALCLNTTLTTHTVA